jgi:hypothetical protein
MEAEMMTRIWKPIAVAALGTVMMTTSYQAAEAGSRGRVATGVAVGVIAGAAVAGAIASSRPAYAEPVYVAPDCSEWRRQARYYERTGRYGRAEYYWDRYRECRGE